MPRRKITEKHTIYPDPRYNSMLVTKFTNGIMETGKKSLAQRIFYGAMDIIEQQVTDQEPIAVFDKAMEKVRPKVGPSRNTALGFRWIIGFAKSRSGKTMSEKLAAELMDAYNERGASVKKRDDTHRMAEANKAFAHYRW